MTWLPIALGFVFNNLIVKPVTQPTGYRKYWGMIAGGVLGIVGVSSADQLGVTQEQMAAAGAVLTAIIGNFLPNR